MIGYEFKTYIADGREHFIYGEREVGGTSHTKKDFPFPESLLLMLTLKPEELEGITHPIDRLLEKFYRTPTAELEAEIMAGLDRLAELHFYFEFLRLDWKWRFELARQNKYRDVMDALPHKQISHIPTEIQVRQVQIQTLFHEVLNAEEEKGGIPKRLVTKYQQKDARWQGRFDFAPCPLSYELTEEGKFTDVLYPKSVYDLIDFALRECLKRELRMRVCKNCGRWFAITGRITAEYCNLPIDEKGRTCRDVAAIHNWEQGKKGNDIFEAYRREYKKRFAWIKSGRVSADRFYEWSAQARAWKEDCEAGRITLEEFKSWLENSQC